eukprot:m.132747 g.132747  ORF g.132747 m.132747 type:complete len:58 (-) comp29628_c6_seq3:28-201(-)
MVCVQYQSRQQKGKKKKNGKRKKKKKKKKKKDIIIILPTLGNLEQKNFGATANVKSE